MLKVNLAAFGERFLLRDSRAQKALKHPLFRLCFDELFPCMFIWNLIMIKRAQWRDCGRAQGAGRAQCGALSLPPGRCAAGRRQRARVSPSSLGKHGGTAGWWQGSRACSRTAGSVPAQAGLEMGHDVGRMCPGSLAPHQHPYLHPTSGSHISVPHPHPHQHLLTLLPLAQEDASLRKTPYQFHINSILISGLISLGWSLPPATA